jgi:O-methyltransferase
MTILSRWLKHWRAERERQMPPALLDLNVYGRYMTGIEIFQPWLRDPDIANLMRELNAEQSTTLVSSERLWTIKWAFLQTRCLPGEVWEAGVYRGGVARMVRALILNSGSTEQCALRLFDSFAGLPEPRIGIDCHHHLGDFSDTSLSEVRAFVGEDKFIDYRPGWIPETFAGLDHSIIRLAHVDVDLYESTLNCLRYIYPRLVPGGIIVLDDYGFVTCPGVRKAADEFFIDRPDVLLMLPSGQAILVRTGGAGRSANS